jgi:hypothetical protein
MMIFNYLIWMGKYFPITLMTEIQLTTEINAPVLKCFDIARSIDLHQATMLHTNEKAIAGRTSGLCELNDEVTWEATHFGIKQTLTSKITKLNAPYFLRILCWRAPLKAYSTNIILRKQMVLLLCGMFSGMRYLTGYSATFLTS